MKNVAKCNTLGIAWPNDAVFAAVYRFHTWPVGWDGYINIAFFADRTAFEEFVERKVDWALCEDNDYALKGYEWDLGPNRMTEFDRNISHLPGEDDLHFDVIVQD
jgi:hypothetical protein